MSTPLYRLAALCFLICMGLACAADPIAPEKLADLTVKLLESDANLQLRAGGNAFVIAVFSSSHDTTNAALVRAFSQRKSGRFQYSVHSALATGPEAFPANGRVQAGKIGAAIAIGLRPELLELFSRFTRTNQILSITTDKDAVEPVSLAIVSERNQVQIYRSDPALKAENVRLASGMLALTRSRASADYRENYREAIKAADFKNWKEAARRLRGALSENPTEGETVLIYGLRYELYLPHYFLGVALYHLGNCESALLEWNVSDRQGAIRRSPEYKNLSRYRQRCTATQGTGTAR